MQARKVLSQRRPPNRHRMGATKLVVHAPRLRIDNGDAGQFAHSIGRRAKRLERSWSSGERVSHRKSASAKGVMALKNISFFIRRSSSNFSQMSMNGGLKLSALITSISKISG